MEEGRNAVLVLLQKNPEEAQILDKPECLLDVKTEENAQLRSDMTPPRIQVLEVKSKETAQMQPDVAATRIQAIVRRFLAVTRYHQLLKKQERRTKIAEEILKTEQTFVQNLERLSRIFLKPLKASGLLTEKTSPPLTSIFSGIDVILGYNSQLLKQLTERISSWSPSTTIGDIFLSIVKFLKTYTQYVNNYKNAVDVLDQLRGTRAFIDWEEKLNKAECGGLRLVDYLIMPIQRIPRYNLLLEDLFNNTWKDHRDYGNLQDALHKMKEVTTAVNKAQLESENKRLVASIDNSLIGKRENLASVPWREFVHDGNVVDNRGKVQYLCVFNDGVLIAKPKNHKRKFVAYVDLLSLKFGSDSNPPPTNFFIEMENKREKFKFFCKSEFEKNQWLKHLTKATEIRQKKQADCLTVKQQQQQQQPTVLPQSSSSESDVQVNEDEESARKRSVLRSFSLKFSKKEMALVSLSAHNPQSRSLTSLSSSEASLETLNDQSKQAIPKLQEVQNDPQQDILFDSTEEKTSDLAPSSKARLTNLWKSKKTELASSRKEKMKSKHSSRFSLREDREGDSYDTDNSERSGQDMTRVKKTDKEGESVNDEEVKKGTKARGSSFSSLLKKDSENSELDN